MKKPVLDKRTKEDILELIRTRGKSYTPEWHFDGDSSDPGAALASIFADMYGHTLDRFNSLPDKYRIEFMNMLGVTEPDISSATGFVRFDIHERAESAVVIPEKTMVGATDENTGSSITFETENRIEATPAKLTSIFYNDVDKNILEKYDVDSKNLVLFGSNNKENITGHELFLSHNEVLTLKAPSVIKVELLSEAAFQDRNIALLLGNEEEANWKWLNKDKWVLFDKVEVVNESILLYKNSSEIISADENGHICIKCELKKPLEIELKQAKVSLTPIEDIKISELTYNDLPLKNGQGFCFGHRPSKYDVFYLRSDRVFCKKGADVTLTINMVTEGENPVKEGVRYDWTKNIISKEDTDKVVADEVSIKEVVWEYFNGEGWAVLPVSGNTNPFIPVSSETKNILNFEIPRDIESATVNAQDGYYIRARVADIENELSLNPIYMLPVIKNCSCNWQYLNGNRCEYVKAVNDGNVIEIEDALIIDDLRLNAFSFIQSKGRNIYFCFDREPNAMPLTMLFQFNQPGLLPGKVNYEAYINGRFVPVHVTDGTNNFKSTGIVSMFLTEKLTCFSLFGEKGFFIRLNCDGYNYTEDLLPKLDSVDVNVVPVIQHLQADTQYFNTTAYDSKKVITLLETPAQEVEVWIDETGKLFNEELSELKSKQTLYRELKDEDGVIHNIIYWKRVKDIRLYDGNARVYELDAKSGVITFGDNIHGKIPPEGGDNIKVTYCYGGGTIGNLPIGAIKDLIGSIPMVDKVTNITETCGGTDGTDEAWLERVGTLSLRHQSKAIGINDYEDMIIEKFPRVFKVKCFSGKNAKGESQSGHVTVVFLCDKATNLADTNEIARQIYNYLSNKCDCNLIATNRLHVIPAIEIKVSVEANVKLIDLNMAADTQQLITDEITSLINNVWRQRGIGQQTAASEFSHLISQCPNVLEVKQLLVSGAWMENGVEYACDLLEDHDFPYTTVRSGEHIIRVQ